MPEVTDSSRITLREYETATIGDRWDAPLRQVSSRQAQVIEAYQMRTGRPLFEIGLRKLKATQWVGSLGIGRFCLDVVPKIDRIDSSLSPAESRRNLLYMVSRTRNVSVVRAGRVPLGDTGEPLINTFLRLYVDELGPEWRRGQIRRYQAADENRLFLRGKLLFADHMKENLTRRDRFFTRSDEFTADNPVSQILKAALNCCGAPLLGPGVQNRAKALMAEFEGVTGRSFQLSELDSIQLDRSLRRFEDVFRLAKFILREISPSRSRQTEEIYSLMFDMNQLFEEFIAVELQQSTFGSGLTVRSQFSNRSLLVQEGRRRFSLCPDIGVYRGDDVACLIDTKWKRLDRSKPHDNVSQADMYQMYAYGKEYGSRKVVLLYPRHGDLPPILSRYQHPPRAGEERREIWIATADVSQPLSNPAALRQLREGLRALI